MDKVLMNQSADGSVQAIDLNRSNHLVELHKLLQPSTPEVDVCDEADCRWFMSGISHPFLNAVKLVKFNSTELDNRIDATLQAFTSRNLPMTWWVGPASEPTNLGQALKTHGLKLDDELPGMALNLEEMENLVPPDELTIERVSNSEVMQRYRTAFKNGYGLPDIFADFFMKLYSAQGFDETASRHYFLGEVNGEPVACSTLYLGAGVAGIYAVGTAPEHRGKGYGTAISAHALRHAYAKGYHVGILQSTKAGLSIYNHMGFKEICRFQIYTTK